MNEALLAEAFPDVDPGVAPLGARVLVQLKTTRKKSSGGIILVDETKSETQWNTQVAKVLKVGPIAFCNRETGQRWPEGSWIQPGDYVRVPRWGGDKHEMPVPGQEERAVFRIFNDHELIAKITTDPLAITDYIL